jgi:hypothetical protein
VKVHIPRTDPAYPMLAHKDSRVRFMEEVSCQAWKFPDDLLGHIGMSQRRSQYSQPWRAEQSRNKRPGLRRAPQPLHHSRVCGDAHELIENRPGGIPRVRPAPLLLEPVARTRIQWRIRVRGIDQDICIDDKHALPPFHGLVQSVPVRDINQGAPAVEYRQGNKLGALFLGPEQAAQCRLHQLRHCSALARGLTFELSHDFVVNVERGLHMENHIGWKAIC